MVAFVGKMLVKGVSTHIPQLVALEQCADLVTPGILDAVSADIHEHHLEGDE